MDRINTRRDYPYLRLMYECLDIDNILRLVDLLWKEMKQNKLETELKKYGVESLIKLVKLHNNVRDINWSEREVIEHYQVWKKKLIFGYLSGYFRNAIINANVMKVKVIN